MDLELVISRLRKFKLKEYNSPFPIVFVDARDPDDACYKCYHKFAESILKQDKNMIKQIKSIFNDISIKKIDVP